MEPYNGMPNQSKKIMSLQDKKKANGLCILSLILCYGPTVLSMLFSIIYVMIADIRIFQPFVDLVNSQGAWINGVVVLLEGIRFICFVVAMALMIVVRVNYPDSTFGKVIMWIYIVQIILIVVGVIVAVIACGVMINSCIYGIRGCGEIGYLLGCILH